MVSPDYILRASVEAIKQGRNPHCFSAWIQGKGYVNDGSTEELRKDYEKQAVRACQSEIDNMGYAPKYSEGGYNEEGLKGIFFANWNVFPRETPELLERLGYKAEWSDEWTTCADCGAAVRTEPDSYGWTPYYREVDGDTLCHDCCPKEEEEEEKED